MAACSHEAPQASHVAANVKTEIASVKTFPRTVAVAGTVRSATSSALAAKSIGNVTRVLVSEGDRVRAGQVLIEIDSREAAAAADRARAGVEEVERAIDASGAAVRAAEANASLAETTFKRYSVLRERGYVSPQEFDDVQARARVAAAELDRARRMRAQAIARRSEARSSLAEAQTFVDDTRVRAPIDGVITARFVDPGGQAAPGMPLLTIEDPASSRVETSVDEQTAAQIRPGDAVTIEAGGRQMTARVTRVVLAVDPATRSALVKIDLPPNNGLRSGTYTRVLFSIGTRQAIAVPLTAIAQRGSLTSVFVAGTDNVARMRLVTVGGRSGDEIEILSGIDEGERIVTAAAAVRDGVSIASLAERPR